MLNKNSHHRDPKPEPKLLFWSKPGKPKLHQSSFSSVMSSFNDSFVSESLVDSDHIGGEDCGDIFNIFDFDKDDDVVGRMQSEWDEDTSTTTKTTANLRSSWPPAIYQYITQTSSSNCLSCNCLSILRDPDMCHFEQKLKYEQDSILLQWVFLGSRSPVFTAGG